MRDKLSLASQPFRRKGLTLMELLVVIGIIVVLAGILYVALAPAREKGRLTHCINNFRQLYLALESYRQDWDGVDFETAHNFDDLALPLTPYVVVGTWPFQKVIWIWGTQDLWLCRSKTSRRKLYGGVYIDYDYRPWARYALVLFPDMPEEDAKLWKPYIEQLEQEFRRRRGEFVVLYDLSHGQIPRRVAPGRVLVDPLILRLNGQIKLLMNVENDKWEEW
ncbi:prepilin-type N-terminal cleavage/methylation domain-containing protein [Candidatus Fervidibacteria bacterium JGI MDM2 JNZ-1-D12]